MNQQPLNQPQLGPPKGGNRFSAWLGNCLLKLTGWKIEGVIPNYPKMVIAVAPHTSNWDFFLGVAVLFALRIRISFLGKHTIFVPIVRIFLEAIGGIPVNRKSAHGVVDQIADKFEKHEQMILAVAPEGTRTAIYPWKTGFMAIAHKAQVPIVLVGFDFKEKKVKIDEGFFTTGDQAADMQRVYDYYSNFHPKHPHDMLIAEPKSSQFDK